MNTNIFLKKTFIGTYISNNIFTKAKSLKNGHSLVCAKDFLGGLSVVKSHGFSKKHVDKMNASFISEHNIAINVSDYLTELVKSILFVRDGAQSGIENV